MNSSNWMARTVLLLGNERVAKFANSNVMIVGLGGVGAAVSEFLCRAGIGKMTIVDGDIIEASNRNRQIQALANNEGKLKAKILGERLMGINPELKIKIIPEFLIEKNRTEILSGDFDCVVDAIDSLSSKVFLLSELCSKKIRVVSSMGSAGKTDPSLVKIADISETHNCPLAKMVRKRLHKFGIDKGFKAVFSTENTPEKAIIKKDPDKGRSIVGSISYVPVVFGAFCAAEVLNGIK